MVDSFRDEVRRERLPEQLLALLRISALGKGHRTGVKPCIEHLRNAVHHAATFLAQQRDLIYVRSVKIGIATEPQFRRRADAALLLALVADPERQRRAPVP